MSSSNQHSFLHWRFAPTQNLLFNRNDSSEHILEAKQADLLAFLISHQNQIVSREQLIEHVWHNRYVDEKTVNSTISRLRKILGGGINEYIKTHPKRGYSFVAPLDLVTYEDRPKAQELSKSKHKIAIFACLFLMAAFLWFSLKKLEQQGITQTLTNTPPVPLTDSIGWEMFPQISAKNLLAYIYFDLETRTSFTKIQTIQPGNIREIISIKHAIFPSWSNDGKTLYYQQWHENECFLEYRTLLDEDQFSSPQQLTPCPQKERTTISVDSKHQWIYYDAKALDGKSRVVKRKNLNTNKVEELTRSGATYNQDRSVALSPNGQYLTFVREYTKRDHQLMLLDIYNGEITSLTKIRKTNYISRPTWHTDNETVFFVSDEKAISSINITTKKQSLRYQGSEPLSHVAISPNKQLVFMQGKQVISNAVQVNLEQSPLKTEYIARSTFENYAATTYRNKETVKSAFVSFRSESEQIWLKEGTHYTQLTDFSSGGTTYLLFSDNGEQLLFMRQQALYFLNIKTKKVTLAELPWLDYKYPYWQCGSNSTIILSALDSGQWNLYQYDIEKKVTRKITENIASYHHSCEQNRRFVTLPDTKGIFELDGNGQIFQEKHYFKDTAIKHWRNWDAYANKLYVMTSYSTFNELDLTSLSIKERKFSDLTTWAINVEYGYMVLNKSTEQDTHLAMVSLN